MKILLPFFLALITLSACGDGKKPNNSSDNAINLEQSDDQKLKLNGTWELVSYYNYVDNKVVDSFLISTGFRQVKMYTDKKVMWSKNVRSDSTEWFGYGSYKNDDNQLIESLEFGSKMMQRIIEENYEFKYELVLEKNKFTQIEIDDDGNRLYSENYQRIE